MNNDIPPIPSREELGRIVDQAMMGRPCWNEKVCNAGEAIVEACGVKRYQARIAELEEHHQKSRQLDESWLATQAKASLEYADENDSLKARIAELEKQLESRQPAPSRGVNWEAIAKTIYDRAPESDRQIGFLALRSQWPDEASRFIQCAKAVIAAYESQKGSADQ